MLFSTDSLLIQELNLYDKKATLRRKTTVSGGSTQVDINVDGLSTDTYIAEIKSVNGYVERHLFLKQ